MVERKVLDGYHYVVARYDCALREAPHAQCGVVFSNDGTIHFISYTTAVIAIDSNGWLSCTGLYSATTRKQIGKFLKEYAPTLDYYDVKHCMMDDLMVNIDTKEFKALG